MNAVKSIGKFTIIWTDTREHGSKFRVSITPGQMILRGNDGEISCRNKECISFEMDYASAQAKYNEFIRYAIRQPDVNIYHLLNKSVWHHETDKLETV